MPTTPPHSSSSTTVPVTVPANRRNCWNSVAAIVIKGLLSKEIRRADNDMDTLRTLLEDYLSIIPLHSKEAILTKFGRLQVIRESLKGRHLSLKGYFREAKTYKQLARETLEFTKDASDRAREDDVVGTLARETGRSTFTTDLPSQLRGGLHRVHSTTSDASDCTLPVAAVDVDRYYSCTDEENNSSRSVSPMTTALSFDESIAPLTDLSSLAPTSVGD